MPSGCHRQHAPTLVPLSADAVGCVRAADFRICRLGRTPMRAGSAIMELAQVSARG